MLDTTRLRQGLYRLAGAGFLPPERARIEQIGPSVVLLCQYGLQSFVFATPWQDLALASEEVRIEALAGSYNATFEAGSAGCPPVESAFTADPAPGSSAALHAELKRTYLRAGLRPETLFAGLVDHLAVELEVMAALCAQELEAYQRQDASRADRVLAQQRSFLGDHLAGWFPAFNTRLQATATAHSFYQALGRAVHAFILHDRELLDLAGDADS